MGKAVTLAWGLVQRARSGHVAAVTSSPTPARSSGLGTREFVALMAALMASNALAIDSMLPALPAIGEALGVMDENRRQVVVTAYLIGFGAGTLLYGPLSDRFGRKWLLAGSLFFYGAFGLAAGFASSFEMLLGIRFLQGVAAAATRVLVVSVVRDLYAGPAMARIMSITMIVFMIVPVLAPALGQGVLAIGTWREIFYFLGIYGAILAVWMTLRLKETLPLEARRPLSARSIGEAAWETLRTRQSIGNTLALTMLLGGLFAFINSIQQIVFDVFGQPEMLGLVFACVAGPMAISSYANSRLVMRYGSRRLLLIALSGFTAMAAIHLTVAEIWSESLWLFVALQAGTMIFFGMVGANAGALAMEPLGHVAGTASSLQGMITTIGGAGAGFAIGQSFDGTTIPFLIGFTSCGVTALLLAFWANRPPSADTHDEAEIDVKEMETRPA